MWLLFCRRGVFVRWRVDMFLLRCWFDGVLLCCLLMLLLCCFACRVCLYEFVFVSLFCLCSVWYVLLFVCWFVCLGGCVCVI